MDEAAVRAAIQEQHGMRCVRPAVWRLVCKGLVREPVRQCRRWTRPLRFGPHRCLGTGGDNHECAPRCVGWYHSHPSFAAVPSVIDIANQARQQIAHRCVWADVHLRLWHRFGWLLCQVSRYRLAHHICWVRRSWDLHGDDSLLHARPLCRDDDGDGGAEPYVAAIVSPYGRQVTSPQSVLTWFRVEHPLGRLPPGGRPAWRCPCLHT